MCIRDRGGSPRAMLASARLSCYFVAVLLLFYIWGLYSVKQHGAIVVETKVKFCLPGNVFPLHLLLTVPYAVCSVQFSDYHMIYCRRVRGGRVLAVCLCIMELSVHQWAVCWLPSCVCVCLQHANEDVEKMILGNKCDMVDKRQVPRQKGEEVD